MFAHKDHAGDKQHASAANTVVQRQLAQTMAIPLNHHKTTDYAGYSGVSAIQRVKKQAQNQVASSPVIQLMRLNTQQLAQTASMSSSWEQFAGQTNSDDYLSGELETFWSVFGGNVDRADSFSGFLDVFSNHVDPNDYNNEDLLILYDQYLRGGVRTRAEFYTEFAESGVDDHGYDTASDPLETPLEFEDEPMEAFQMKRKPGISGPKNYPGYKNMEFMKTTPNATIDFDAGRNKSSSKKNNKPGSGVDLKTLLTGKKIKPTIKDPHTKKNIKVPRAGQTFDKANRDQHFALADTLYYLSHGTKINRAGTWTWHHLETKYQMVLVNMLVHSKHGHNGGVYLW